MSIQIRLTNFKIHDNKCINFPNTGVVLLSGPSGRGKSSMLSAILYCMYGEGRNITSFERKKGGEDEEVKEEEVKEVDEDVEEKKPKRKKMKKEDEKENRKKKKEVIKKKQVLFTQVEMDFGDFVILRKNKPNYLCISFQDKFQDKFKNNQTIENQIAQEWIFKEYGTFFSEIGYIQQNSFETFNHLNPTKKLEFIEKSLFRDINMNQIKDRLKNDFKVKNDSLQSLVSNIKLLNEMFQQEKEPVVVKKPNSLMSLDETRIEQVSIQKELTMVSESYQDVVRKIEMNEKNKNKLDIISIKSNQANVELDDISKRITDASTKTMFVDEYKKKVKRYILLKNYKSIIEKKKELLIIKEREDVEKKEKIEHIKSILWKKGTKKENTDNIHEWTEYKDTMSELNNLLNRKEKIKEKMNEKMNEKNNDEKNDEKNDNYLEIEIQQLRSDIERAKESLNVLLCPHCNGNIRYMSFKLQKADTSPTSKDEIGKLEVVLKGKIHHLTIIKQDQIKNAANKEQLSNIEENITKIEEDYDIMSVDDIQKEIQTLQKYINENEQYEKELFSLQKQSSIVEKDINLIIQKEKDIEISYGGEVNADDDILTEDEYIRISSHLSSIEEEKKTMMLLTDKRRLIKETLHCLLLEKEGLCIYNEEELYDLLCKRDLYSNKKEDIGLKLKQLQKDMDDIHMYNVYMDKQERYNSLLTRINNAKDEEQIKREELLLSNKLKSKIVEAETKVISSFINTLSHHVNAYLEKFFRDEPIFVNIQNHKENKTGVKHGIHITVDFRGNECELQHLSGGENDRINLAFSLSLSEMFNNKILLLDECISSLDSETFSHTVNGLKYTYGGKLVIVVAHQSNHGLFDTVINI